MTRPYKPFPRRPKKGYGEAIARLFGGAQVVEKTTSTEVVERKAVFPKSGGRPPQVRTANHDRQKQFGRQRR